MGEQWAVVQISGDRDDDKYVYGPFADEEQAKRFAAFVSVEIDPARAYRLGSPVAEFLGWYGNREASS